MNTQHYQDYILESTTLLSVNAVTCTFNLAVRWACKEMEDYQTKIRCTANPRGKLIKTVYTSLFDATRLYGISMNRRTGKVWSTVIADFILANCYYESAFHTPVNNQIFNIHHIPSQLFESMIQNFQEKKMYKERYNSLTRAY